VAEEPASGGRRVDGENALDGHEALVKINAQVNLATLRWNPSTHSP
jgi:hypothetical protein